MRALFVLPAIGATLIGLLLIACEKDPASSVVPRVTNVRDRFHFQVTEAEHTDTTIYYYWQMDGTSANVDQQASIHGGRVTVTVQDGAQGGNQQRTQVYQTDLSRNGSYVTESGTSGSWLIRFSLVDFSGSIDFRIQRR